ncbi:MAG TPA: bacterial transcriptional activator domain-containing protein [Gemmatimonadaceae bacterium]|nr:bacterial transcriptional activator domain-containing protein [Gemmatimonadaceae bacterium]
MNARVQDGASAQLERALGKYRGDFLDGEPVSDWHVELRDRLQRLYVDSLMLLGEAHAAAPGRAADAYRRVLATDELHEEALRGLMRALGESGERSQALRAYQRFAERLRTELDAEPDEQTMRLMERLQERSSGATEIRPSRA